MSNRSTWLTGRPCRRDYRATVRRRGGPAGRGARATPGTCASSSTRSPGRTVGGKHELITLVTKYEFTSRKTKGRSMINLVYVSGTASLRSQRAIHC